ncbi:MAG: urease accessory protein UreD [Leptolyngbyaceae cyanobacterium bins.349]|nr:urease accessory protein UreD [Leptolyngbyaceae cyanobacterium bins.349]
MTMISAQDERSPFSSQWLGTLDLTFGAAQGETFIRHSHVKAPLKVQRPFFPEGAGVCHSVILHTAGGVVGGDRLLLNLDLQADAQALITTAAAAKIYRSNGQAAQQCLQVRLGANACLEWLPQETIVFEQAQYQQQMRIDLAPGATWLGWEITRLGRTARQERFYAGNWRSRTEVWQGDRPLWIDRQWLPGSEATWHSPHGLAACPVVGTFALVGRPIEADVVASIRETWTGQAGQAGVTRLASGLLCRYRGHSTTEVRQWFIQVWEITRSHFQQRPICIPRVWQL